MSEDMIRDSVSVPEQEPEAEDFHSDIAISLRKKFDYAEQERDEIEGDWLKALRQYKGIYENNVKLDKKRSQAFIRLTRTKVKTATSRIMDILFPANGERNWAINPTPIPTLSPQVMQQLAMQLMQIQGMEQPPSQEEVLTIIKGEAKKRCDAMLLAMEDQLSEVSYRDIASNVIFSGNLYGTGIMKGPMVQNKHINRYVMGQNGWEELDIEITVPYVEQIPIWDIYPEPNHNMFDSSLPWLFQRHLFPKHEMYELAKRKDFDGAAIKSVLRQYPKGYNKIRNHETELRTMAAGTGVAKYDDAGNKYEVLEFWGYLDRDDLEALGVELPEESSLEEFPVNIFMIENVIIKAVLNPLPGEGFPYYAYYFDKDETSIWGNGIASIMRDPQTLFNASIRALIDNAAIAAGPQIEVNIELLPQGEDPTDIHPFRIWQRTGSGVEAQYPALRVFSLPSYTKEFTHMAELFERYADEATAIPRFLHGQQAPGVGRTVRGLSMLMGAANIVVKDQVKSFDEHITKPFIKSLYQWNMIFNPDENIKGDFTIKASGTASLIAKEVQMETLTQFAGMTANPLDAPWVKRGLLMRRIAQAGDIGDDIVKTDEEFGADQMQQQQEQQAAAEAQAQMQQQQSMEAQLEAIRIAKQAGHVSDAEETFLTGEIPPLPGNTALSSEVTPMVG